MRRPISRCPAKFTGADRKRVDTLGAMMGASYISAPGVPRETGVKLPFKGQPMQGFSGLKSVGNGEYWVLQDNGFGTKANSADAMLVLHRIRPDWASGKVDVLRTIFVHDPDRKIPFQIALEGTAKRYLTGADLDVESFQTIGDQIWIGDEFGPYLIRIDQNGKVNAFFETQVDGKPARSPDHYLVSTPAVPGGAVPFTVRRSRGYEGDGGVEGRPLPLSAARRPALGRRQEGLGDGRRPRIPAHPRVRRERAEVDRPVLEVPPRGRTATTSATST